jgi:hypothetical protein
VYCVGSEVSTGVIDETKYALPAWICAAAPIGVFHGLEAAYGRLQAPGAGAGDGGGAVAAFATETCTAGELAALPAASNARATSVCEPFATVLVSQVAAHGEDVSRATTTPSAENSTATTPTLSLASELSDAVPERTEPATGLTRVAVGGVVSPAGGGGAGGGGGGGGGLPAVPFLVVKETGADENVLPAESRAVATIVCDPSATVLLCHGSLKSVGVASYATFLPSTA